jgi:glucose-6-phosphate isomerase/transaldolase/glucose-6-phosphate isomerase
MIRALEQGLPLAETLFLVASKSGTTLEPRCLAAYFKDRLAAAGVARPERHLVAITDEGTPLHEQALQEGWREVFLNPADVGGRYSALSFFGLVPAALMGIDLPGLLAWGRAMARLCRPTTPLGSNPGVGLGLAMGAAALNGRDKLTLITGPRLRPFGLWIEQLVAESTGKRGVGIVPIAGERLGTPDVYGDDRLFVRLRLHGGDPDEHDRDGKVERLRAAGHPIVTVRLVEPLGVGAEFVRWEIATATAGAILSINPFDEPNVQQAKDATGALLRRFAAEGRLPTPPAQLTADGIHLTFGRAVVDRIGAVQEAGPALRAFFGLARPGDYIALLAYLPGDPALEDRLAALRSAIRDRTRLATMLGFGPRYLHSTGQLHKGGPDTGQFVLITADARPDLPIPGEPYSFGVLELAQALGDFESLERAGRRVLRLHLPDPGAPSVERVGRLLEAALTA